MDFLQFLLYDRRIRSRIRTSLMDPDPVEQNGQLSLPAQQSCNQTFNMLNGMQVSLTIWLLFLLLFTRKMFGMFTASQQAVSAIIMRNLAWFF